MEAKPMIQALRIPFSLIYRLYSNEFVVLIKRDFESAVNTIASNELPNCTGGKLNDLVVIGACNHNLCAALIVGQIFFGGYGESKANGA